MRKSIPILLIFLEWKKSKDENVENKNKNIWKNSRRRISLLQVVIFVMIMAGFLSDLNQYENGSATVDVESEI